MLEFLKAPFLALHFSYYTLMTFLTMFCVILLSMQMILLYILSVIKHLIGGNSLSWLLNLNLIYETLWTGVRSGLLISMLGRLNRNFKKIMFLAQVLLIRNETTTTIQRIQREFLCNTNNVKIKHKTIWNNIQNGDLKNVVISNKISSLQCPWVKQLYNWNSHDRKLIPMHFINNVFEKNSIHSNLSFKVSVLHEFRTFYANILQSWERNFSLMSYLVL